MRSSWDIAFTRMRQMDICMYGQPMLLSLAHRNRKMQKGLRGHVRKSDVNIGVKNDQSGLIKNMS